jgi:hypothetical protein
LLARLLEERPETSADLKKIREESNLFVRESIKNLKAQHLKQTVDPQMLLKLGTASVPPNLPGTASPQATEAHLSDIDSGSEQDLNPTVPQWIALTAQGRGDGWSKGGAVAATFLPLGLGFAGGVYDDIADIKYLQYRFEYTAPAPGDYLFSVWYLAWGTYTLVADDGWPDTKNASLKIWATNGSIHSPNLDVALTRQTLLERGDDNINETSTFAEAICVRSNVTLVGGLNEYLWSFICMEVSARGDESVAQIDMTPPAGGGIFAARYEIAPI